MPQIQAPQSSRQSYASLLLCSALLVALAFPLAGRAQAPVRKQFDLPAESADKSLRRFSLQSGNEVLFATQLAAKIQTNRVKGEYTSNEAANRLLEGTGLVASQDRATGVFTISREDPDPNVPRAAHLNDRPASTATTKELNENEDVEVLSRFYVEGGKSRGYQTQETLSGSRYAKALLDLPGGITVINEELMSDLGATNLGDALNFGVSGATKNQTYTDDYNIRGFRSTQTLQDGYPMPSVYAQRAVTYDIEAVEVIKGPAAMVLGQNSDLGGVINTVTRKPTKRLKADIDLSLAEHDYRRFAANVSGPLLLNKDLTLLYRVTLGGLRGGREKEIESDMAERYFSSALTLQFGSRSTLLSKFEYSDHDGFIYGNDFIDITAPVNPDTGLQKAVLNRLSTASYSAGRSKNAKLGGSSRIGNLTGASR